MKKILIIFLVLIGFAGYSQDAVPLFENGLHSFGKIGINTRNPKNNLSIIGSASTDLHMFNMVCSDHNMNRSTYAQAIDTSSFNFSFTATGKPFINFKNENGVDIFSVDSAGYVDAYMTTGSYLDTTDQTVGTSPVAVKFNVSDIEQGMSLAANDTVFTLNYPGHHLIMFSVIMLPSQANKYFEIYLEKNGSPYPMSNTVWKSIGTNQARIVTVSYNIPFAAGDTFKIKWFSDDASAKLDYTTASATLSKVLCPSIILTVNKTSK